MLHDSTLTFLGTGHGNANYRRNQSCMLLRLPGGRNYLIDCGDCASTSLIRRGVEAASLDAVFVTHIHDDHVGGIVGVIKMAAKYRSHFPEKHTQFLLPEVEAVHALEGWVAAIRIPYQERQCGIFGYVPGVIYDENGLTVTAWATNHNPPGKSCAFAFQFAGKCLVCTGDLAGDFHDFPLAQINALPQPPEAVVCELTHYSPENAMPLMASLKTKRLIFNHVHDPWDLPEKRRQLADWFAKLSYPVQIAEDNTEWQF